MSEGQSEMRERLKSTLANLKYSGLINSQKDVADGIGYSPSRLSEVMNGRTKLNLDFLQKFCIKYNQSLDYIVMGLSGKTKHAENLTQEKGKDFGQKPNVQKKWVMESVEEELAHLRGVVADQARALANMSRALGTGPPQAGEEGKEAALQILMSDPEIGPVLREALSLAMDKQEEQYNDIKTQQKARKKQENQS